VAGDLAPRLNVVSGWLFVALWLLVVVDLGLQSPALRRVAEGVLALLILLAMLKASPHIRLLASVLLTGTGVLMWRAEDWGVIERGLGAALAVGAFLPVVALVRATVYASPTVPAIRERLGAMSSAERRTWMTGGAHLLGSILTLGYVSVQRPMLPREIGEAERMSLAECGVRGLGMAVVWSPFFVASAVAGQLVRGVAAWQIVALGLALAAIGGVIAHLMFNRGLDLRSFGRAVARLEPIVVPTVLLVGAVVATSGAMGWSVLQSVIVVVPACCAVYLLAFARDHAPGIVPDVATSAGRMGDEVLILTASTVFGAAMAGVAMPDGLAESMRAVGDRAWIVIALSVLTIAVLGIVGLHPMVSASVIVPACIALRLPIADVVLAHIVVLGWALSSISSAWTLPVVITAGAFGVPVRRLVFGPNLRFVAVFGVAAVTALVWLNAALVP
jgi:hypothetical protein